MSWRAIGGVFVGIAVLGLAGKFVIDLLSSRTSAAQASAAVVEAYQATPAIMPPTPPPGPPPAKTFIEAVSNSRDSYPNVSGVDLPDIAFTLASWSRVHDVRIEDINEIRETSRSLVLKDARENRGHRICVSGSVAQITRDERFDNLYQVIMLDENAAEYRLLSFGSTGSVVARSYARFCGVSLGRNLYPSLSGDTREAVLLVGMFDLAENRRTPIKRPRAKPEPKPEPNWVEPTSATRHDG